MPFDFPSAPTVGDTHTQFGVEYVYDGQVWNLAGGGAMGDYVLKTGDEMTGPLNIKIGAPGGVKVIASDPAHGHVHLSGGAADRTGMVEFFMGTQRKARVGWGTATEIELAFENGSTGLRMIGGGLRWGSDTAQTDPLNLSRGVCLYGYGGPSQFGFSITSGTLNYVVQNTGNMHIFRVGAEEVMSVKSDGVRIPGGNLNVTGTIRSTGEIRSDGNIFAERDLHATGNLDVDGVSDFAGNIDARGTTELRGPVNTRASFNAYGGVRLMDNQQLHFDSGKNEGEGQGVAMVFRKKGGAELWGEIAIQAVDYGSSSVDEANLRVQLAQGGYGWSNAIEIKTGQVYCPRDCSAAAFIDRGVAATKSDIRDTQDAEVNAAFAALQPRRFRKNNIDPVDVDGNPLPPLPTPKLRFGFVADELYARPEVMDVVGTDLHGEIIGTDIMQVLALTVAKVKLLEAEIEALRGA